MNKEQEEKSKYKTENHNVSISKREKPLDITLYEDAERRRVDLAKKKEELDKMREKPKEEMYHNDKSDKYV